MLTSLDQIKAHLNIDQTYKGDDEYLVALAKAAEDAIAKRINVRRLNDILIDGATLPESISHAILLLIGNWYSNRESVSQGNVVKLPHGFDFLADLNKSYHSIF